MYPPEKQPIMGSVFSSLLGFRSDPITKKLLFDGNRYRTDSYFLERISSMKQDRKDHINHSCETGSQLFNHNVEDVEEQGDVTRQFFGRLTFTTCSRAGWLTDRLHKKDCPLATFVSEFMVCQTKHVMGFQFPRCFTASKQRRWILLCLCQS